MKVQYPVRKLIELIKQFGVFYLYHLGYYDRKISRKIQNGTGLTILTYHSIIDKRIKHPGLEVSEKNFVQQLKYLKKYFQICKIEDAVEQLTVDGDYKNKLVVTFDDGYKSNFSIAYPILKREKIPATIFLTTDPIEKSSMMWTNKLDLAISKTKKKYVELGNIGKIDLSSKVKKVKAIKLIKKHLKSLKYYEMNKILEDIYGKVGDENLAEYDNRYDMLSPNEIYEMSKNNISFGGHTCTHPIVSKLSPTEFENEINLSHEKISGWTKKTVKYFAYPNGLAGDFTEENKAELKEKNIQAALTMLRGINNEKTDKYELRRIPIKNCTLPEFSQHLLKYI